MTSAYILTLAIPYVGCDFFLVSEPGMRLGKNYQAEVPAYQPGTCKYTQNSLYKCT